MKARHRSMAEALDSVIDDLQAALIEAPDTVMVEQARNGRLRGAEASRVRKVLWQVLRRDSDHGSWPGLTRAFGSSGRSGKGVEARVKPGHDDER